MNEYKILPCGDTAVTVCFGEEISEKIALKVRFLYDKMLFLLGRGVTDLIPAYSSLTVCYDPARISYVKICKTVSRVVSAGKAVAEGKKTVHCIPVCYGGVFGEDLSAVAEMHGLNEEEVISLHSGRDYLIYMIGFLPGFPYLGGMDNRIATPRLETPRTSIPVGSVGIGGAQTGIYPMASPGGWRLIGRTPEILYKADREPPVLYKPGEYIRFCPVTAAEYQSIAERVARGEYVHKVTEE